MTTSPVVVVGAGPVGLAAAAHLVKEGLEPLVLEAGDTVGASVASWGHVRLFSPWHSNIDAAATVCSSTPAGRSRISTRCRPVATSSTTT
jgi:cation diffusion facilitator CzcD-associated flavoprotein CzcO